jgi:UPF0755 protein
VKRLRLAITLTLLGFAAYWAWTKYQSIYAANVQVDESTEFFVHTGSDFSRVSKDIERAKVLKDLDSFYWVAKRKDYDKMVKPGRYILKNGMSNNELVNLLRSGKQTPVKVSFNNVRNLAQLAGKVAKKLEGDSLSFLKAFTNDSTIAHYGFRQENFIALFIPNTYELYWNTSEAKFIDRMAGEFKRFWTDDRLAKAKKKNLTQSEVVTLASIVQAEQSEHTEEWPIIAGLYLNRLEQGIPLQSDPTVIFAVGDFRIRRVLNEHLKRKSPYNTYLNSGLPPGPIRMPDRGAIDAVLSPQKHEYIFMCAKPDGSGTHHFSKTLREHNQYAREYRNSMNKRGIFN